MLDGIKGQASDFFERISEGKPTLEMAEWMGELEDGTKVYICTVRFT